MEIKEEVEKIKEIRELADQYEQKIVRLKSISDVLNYLYDQSSSLHEEANKIKTDIEVLDSKLDALGINEEE